MTELSSDPSRLGHSEAMAKYLQTFTWNHFATLTVGRTMSASGVARLFESDFVRRLAAVAKMPIPYFYAIEHAGEVGSQPHIHALLSGTGALPADRVRSAWKHGLTDVSAYDARRAAARYTTKDLLLNPDNYDFSKRPAPKRTDTEAVAIRAMLAVAVPDWAGWSIRAESAGIR